MEHAFREARKSKIQDEEKIKEERREWLKDQQANYSLAISAAEKSAQEKRISAQSGRGDVVLQEELRRKIATTYAAEKNDPHHISPPLKSLHSTSPPKPPSRFGEEELINLINEPSEHTATAPQTAPAADEDFQQLPPKMLQMQAYLDECEQIELHELMQYQSQRRNLPTTGDPAHYSLLEQKEIEKVLIKYTDKRKYALQVLQ